MRLNPEFLFQRIDDEGVLVPVGRAAERFSGMVRLNGTAAFLAEKLREETTPEALRAALEEEYDGTPEQFAASVETTLATLREIGALIE